MVRQLVCAWLIGGCLAVAARPAGAQFAAVSPSTASAEVDVPAWTMQQEEAEPPASQRLPILGIDISDLALRSSTVRSPVTQDRSFSIRFPLDDREALHVTTGYTRIVSAPDVFWNTLPAKATWKFKAVPITFGYEHALSAPERRLVPTVGAGLTFYFTRMKHLNAPQSAGSGVDRPGVVYSHASPSFAYGYGAGFGAQATLGLRYSLTPGLFVLGQTRLRYVDGLAFSNGGLGARFACLDFIAGVGIEL